MPLDLQPHGALLLAPGPDAAERLAADALLGQEVELYRMRDEDAALHLFRVAAGLDSLVPGEGEILGQVREAYEAGAHGPVLDRLFREALRVGKKVRTETAIAESPASVSSAAAALAQQVFGELTGCSVLLVGAGEVSELAARALTARGATIGAVTSRTQESAARLAEAFDARTVPFDDLGRELEQVDVVVSSTSSPEPVLSREQVPNRHGRPLFVIDLAVPRDVDPAVAELEDCYLYDIDDLQAVVRESLSGRRREAERAEAIVEQEIEAVSGLAGEPARRSGDRVAARAGGEHPLRRARQGRGAARGPLRERAPHGRVADDADREQAPPCPDRAHEGSRRDRGRGLRRGRAAPVRPRGGREC